VTVGEVVLTLAATAGVVLAFMVVMFVIGLAAGRHTLIDVAWGPSFGLVAITAFAVTTGHGDTGRRLLLLGCVLVWGLRLGAHIGRRSRGTGEDPRYADMLAKAPGSPAAYAFRKVYLTQAAIVWVVSVPLQTGMLAAGRLGPVAIAGGIVWAGGLIFEAVGDLQLSRFKASPARRGAVLDTGLWRYTRHPNYFGDACVWWGLFLISLGSPLGLVTAFSPLLMTYLLAAGSGKPITEGRMAARPGYASYVARTSGFVPLPPRRH
jgi:steroid 5-alpha reductase family enzyme